MILWNMLNEIASISLNSTSPTALKSIKFGSNHLLT